MALADAVPRANRQQTLAHFIQDEFRCDLARLEQQLHSSAGSSETPVSRAALNLLRAGGKRVRPLLAWMSCSALGTHCEKVDAVAVAAELTHAATLLHDDVLDEGEQRRGVPASRILFGNRISILGGDYLLVRALEALLRTRKQSLLKGYLNMLHNTVAGEVLQHENRFDVTVSESVYDQIVQCKTAALFGWTAEAAAMVAGADPHLVEAVAAFGRSIGVSFQILDDWLDWTGDELVAGKAVRSDLKEGKPSLAVIYGCQMSPTVRRWFQAHVRDDAPAPSASDIARLAAELDKCGAIARVRRKLEEETTAAVRRLEVLPPSAARDRLQSFAKLLVQRES